MKSDFLGYHVTHLLKKTSQLWGADKQAFTSQYEMECNHVK